MILLILYKYVVIRGSWFECHPENLGHWGAGLLRGGFPSPMGPKMAALNNALKLAAMGSKGQQDQPHHPKNFNLSTLHTPQNNLSFSSERERERERERDMYTYIGISLSLKILWANWQPTLFPLNFFASAHPHQSSGSWPKPSASLATAGPSLVTGRSQVSATSHSSGGDRHPAASCTEY